MAIVVAGGRSALSRGASLLTNSPAPCSLSSPNSRQSPQSPQVEAAPVNTFAIVNNSNTQVLHTGSGVYTIEKTAGADGAWNADAVSSSSTSDDFVIRILALQTDKHFTIGFDVAPTVASDQASIDRGLHFTVDPLVGYYENGVLQTSPDQSYDTSTYWWLRRLGSTVTALRGATLSGATLIYTFTSLSGAVFFDSSFYSSGGRAEVTFYRPQDLIGTSSLAFAASATATGNGALVGASALTLAPSATATGLGALSGASTLTFSPSSTLTGKGALSGASTLTFSPSATLAGKGALSGAGSLTFAPSATLTGPGALSGSSTLTFVTGATATGTGALSGTSALSFASSATITGLGALSGTAALTFGPLATLNGLAPITGTASITFAAAGTIAGIAYITGIASLDFSAAGTLTGFDATAAMLRGRRRRRGAFSDYGIWREGGGVIG